MGNVVFYLILFLYHSGNNLKTWEGYSSVSQNQTKNKIQTISIGFQWADGKRKSNI